MAYLAEISTVVPQYSISQTQMQEFFMNSLPKNTDENFLRKIRFLSQKSGINTRYTCIPDFNLEAFELYTENNFNSRVDQRMRKYAEKIIPLSSAAVNNIMEGLGLKPSDITHLITVSCTGILAPGFEIRLAEACQLMHCEKTAINYMGCYAALKAVKSASYIADAVPGSCTLVVCAELCSLHYNVPKTDDDIISSLLFADGAAAALICSENHRLLRNKKVLQIRKMGSTIIPGSSDLMTWNVAGNGFKMYLDKTIADKLGASIKGVVQEFMSSEDFTHYAIHPGGIRILQEVRKALELPEESLRFSWDILRNFGNMSSPTILFILERMLGEMRSAETNAAESIFACAFGPGITVEMLGMSSVTFSETESREKTVHAV